MLKMQDNRNVRKLWLDALRGMAMLFVVLVHVLPAEAVGSGIYGGLISPVMIPLFFAVSGYVFNPCEGKQLRFYKGVFFKLIVPWFFLSLLPVHFLISFLKGPEYLIRYIYLFISGKRLWYIPCCIASEILHFYVRKFARTPVWITAASFLLCGIGLFMAKMNICNFAMINRAFIAQAFILAGYLYRVFEERFQAVSNRMLALCGMAYVFLMLLYMYIWPEMPVDVHMNTYGSFLYFMLQVFLGCGFLFTLAKRIRKLPGALVFLGQNTFVCYALHGIIASRWDKLLVRVCPPLAYSWPSAIAATLIACSLCCAAAVLINRYVPFAAGKKKKPRHASLN